MFINLLKHEVSLYRSARRKMKHVFGSVRHNLRILEFRPYLRAKFQAILLDYVRNYYKERKLKLLIIVYSKYQES